MITTNMDAFTHCSKQFLQGINDLREGLIRTPLNPKETFLDDPLRILRACRFAARFGFRLHPDIESIKDFPDLKVWTIYFKKWIEIFLGFLYIIINLLYIY